MWLDTWMPAGPHPWITLYTVMPEERAGCSSLYDVRRLRPNDLPLGIALKVAQP